MTDTKGLLAVDLDGTAVGDDYRLKNLDRIAIQKAKEKGFVTAFVTGRRDMDMRSLDKEDYCVEYLVLNNGGKIIRCSDKKVIYNQRIPETECRTLIEYCMKEQLELHICDGSFWAVNIMTDETREYADDIKMIPQRYHNTQDIDMSEGLEGFMALRDFEKIGNYIDTYLSGIIYTLSEPECIDIMADGISKWKGIEIIADVEKIEKENIIAVGNFYNDMDMIKNAAIGIAVANAPEDVKKVADYVTERTNNENAIEEVVEQFCINPEKE